MSRHGTGKAAKTAARPMGRAAAKPAARAASRGGAMKRKADDSEDDEMPGVTTSTADAEDWDLRAQGEDDDEDDEVTFRKQPPRAADEESEGSGDEQDFEGDGEEDGGADQDEDEEDEEDEDEEEGDEGSGEGEEDDDRVPWARPGEALPEWNQAMRHRSALTFGLPEDQRAKPTPVGLMTGDQLAAESSDDDDDDNMHSRNTLGNIPLEWYDEFDHQGYSLDGQKILKSMKKDTVDEFIARQDDPNYWRTVYDKLSDQSIVMSTEDMEMVRRMQAGQFADMDYDPYEPWEDFFDYKDSMFPLRTITEPKRRFVPSKWEAAKVAKMVKAIHEGRVKPKEVKPEVEVYDLWADETPVKSRRGVAPPKLKLPVNAESYRPPVEYLPSKEELAAWEELDPEDRPHNFVPKRFDNLRSVPGYANFVRERFDRCLDIYLCPRVRKKKMNVDPKDLVPKLPKPRELRPFPTTVSIVYTGHKDRVRSISVHARGQWLVSGSRDGTAKLWEVETGRCVRTWSLGGDVTAVSWCPDINKGIFIAASDNRAYVIDASIRAANTPSFDYAPSGKESDVAWSAPSSEQLATGIRGILTHPQDIRMMAWHAGGDYFATVSPDANTRAVQIHQLSKQHTQNPFTKSKGRVMSCAFHPSKSYFFVATERYVRVYDLKKLELKKKLNCNVREVTSMAIHPGGDNLIVGSADKKVSWMDLDLSDKPYKVMRYHKMPVRQVAMSPRYPLFASCADDGTVQVFHGRVYNDLFQNALIVPVKILRGHEIVNHLGVVDCQFHPTQPWIFSAGADAKIVLYV